jgi:hypothetical protein
MGVYFPPTQEIRNTTRRGMCFEAFGALGKTIYTIKAGAIL